MRCYWTYIVNYYRFGGSLTHYISYAYLKKILRITVDLFYNLYQTRHKYPSCDSFRIHSLIYEHCST